MKTETFKSSSKMSSQLLDKSIADEKNKPTYFAGLSKALVDAGIAKPTLVLDRARLRHNIQTVSNCLSAAGLELRIAMKSLASLPLLHEISSMVGTDRMMVFNLDYLKVMSSRPEYVDILMGKPLPVLAVSDFYKTLQSYNSKSVENIQWLVDSNTRIDQYSKVAESFGLKIKVNLELDIGICRGGFGSYNEVKQALEKIKADKNLSFSGLMGYEKHIYYVAMTHKGRRKALDKSWEAYSKAIQAIKDVYGDGLKFNDLTLNMAGSVTYQMYGDNKLANEVSIGSGFVKPSNFDTTTLTSHLPAAYIATPVIKSSMGYNIPGLGPINSLIEMASPKRRQTFFVYGGLWNAELEYPRGLLRNKIYGFSSNQESLTGPKDVHLKPDDYVFYRPKESEAVLTQFGGLAIYENSAITDYWPTLPAAP